MRTLEYLVNDRIDFNLAIVDNVDKKLEFIKVEYVATLERHFLNVNYKDDFLEINVGDFDFENIAALFYKEDNIDNQSSYHLHMCEKCSFWFWEPNKNAKFCYQHK